MHIQLTDVLTCPRCGPTTGLIVLADRLVDRRVLEGALGCPNCRTRYPIRGGVADLWPTEGTSQAESGAPGEAASGVDEGEAAFRLAALMGVTRGPGFSLIVGGSAWLAPAVAAMIEQLEVVAVTLGPRGADLPRNGAAAVSRIAAGPALPFFEGSMRAVALSADVPEEMVAEGVRVLAKGGRFVREGAPEAGAARLESLGLRILARQGATIVAVRT